MPRVTSGSAVEIGYPTRPGRFQKAVNSSILPTQWTWGKWTGRRFSLQPSFGSEILTQNPQEG